MLRQLIWTGVILLASLATFWVVSTFFWLPTGQRQRVEFARKISLPLRAHGAEARANGRTLEIESEDYDNSFIRRSELKEFGDGYTLELCNMGFNSLYFYRSGGLFQPNAGSRSPLECDKAQEASARRSVNTLNIAERTYADVFNAGGFSHELSQLRPPTAGSNPGPNASGLVDEDLASGIKDGYSFAYAPKIPDSKGHIHSYTVRANPLSSLHDEEMDYILYGSVRCSSSE